jgi:hypothetical protein
VTEPEETAVDVASWLRTLGLERYEATFRENDVSGDDLCHLTAEDLDGLGVTAIRHRRRLLVAIAALRSEGPSPGDPARSSSDSLSSPTGNLGTSETIAERRPLSVMFCDLIGSTALSSRLDAEDLREVIRTYQACVAATIQRFDGFIARYVGDGVLIYFGWPEARETDAERAVRAGLAVAAAVSQEPVGGETLHVRIGIATGLVVIGEPIGCQLPVLWRNPLSATAQNSPEVALRRLPHAVPTGQAAAAKSILPVRQSLGVRPWTSANSCESWDFINMSRLSATT